MQEITVTILAPDDTEIIEDIQHDLALLRMRKRKEIEYAVAIREIKSKKILTSQDFARKAVGKDL